MLHLNCYSMIAEVEVDALVVWDALIIYLMFRVLIMDVHIARFDER